MLSAPGALPACDAELLDSEVLRFSFLPQQLLPVQRAFHNLEQWRQRTFAMER